MNLWQSAMTGFFVLCLFNPARAIIPNTITNNIISFDQLVQAVENGYNVRAIIFFNRCALTNPTDLEPEIRRRLVDASARFNFNQFFHAKDTINERFFDTVTTSRKTFLESPDGDFFTLFSRLSIFEDNTAILHLVFFDFLVPKKRFVVDWLCTIDRSQNPNLSFNPTLDLSTNQNINQNFNRSQTLNLNVNFNPDQLNNGLVLFY